MSLQEKKYAYNEALSSSSMAEIIPLVPPVSGKEYMKQKINNKIDPTYLVGGLILTSPIWMTMLYKLALEVWCIAYGLIY